MKRWWRRAQPSPPPLPPEDQARRRGGHPAHVIVEFRHLKAKATGGGIMALRPDLQDPA